MVQIPSENPPDTKKEIPKSELLGISYATDAAHLISVNSPIPFVIFGPGDPNNIHRIDEFIELEQMFQAKEFLINHSYKLIVKDKINNLIIIIF